MVGWTLVMAKAIDKQIMEDCDYQPGQIIPVEDSVPLGTPGTVEFSDFTYAPKQQKYADIKAKYDKWRQREKEAQWLSMDDIKTQMEQGKWRQGEVKENLKIPVAEDYDFHRFVKQFDDLVEEFGGLT